MLLKNIQEISFDDSSATRTVMYYPAAGTKPTPTCLPQFGGGSIESRDGESFEGVGETRLTTGTIFTDKLFTGQREMAGLGIYHYGARFYSPKLGRFLSADTIVPGAANPQAYNRYSYVLGNPLKYTDPSGHGQCRTQEECAEMGTTPMGTGGNGGGGGDGGRDGCRHNDPDCRDEGGQGSGCQLTPEYLCQLPKDELQSLSNGDYSSHTASFSSLAPIYFSAGIIVYFGQPVLFAYVLPQAWIPTANIIVVGAEALSFNMNPPPGGAVGDVTISIGHSSNETVTVYGYTVPAYTEVNQYVLREELDGWQLIQSSTTTYNYR